MIDNFSRRILAWKVMPTFDPGATAEILLVAAKGLENGTPTVLADGGAENFNGKSANSSVRGCSSAFWPAPKSRTGIPVRVFP